MEPITMVSLFVLTIGADKLFRDDIDAPVQPEPVTEQIVEESPEPEFKRGVFFRTDAGYYISNLSPEPVEVPGCNQPVLVADLTKPHEQKTIREVQTVQVGCNGG